jgi:hypothetical protein
MIRKLIFIALIYVSCLYDVLPAVAQSDYFVITATAQSSDNSSGDANNKFGISYSRITGYNYSLKETTNNISNEDSTELNGTTLYYEFLLNEQFSIGISYSFYGERSLELTIGTDTYEIIENTTYRSLDFKSYIFDYNGRGLNPYIGISQAEFETKSEITKTDASGNETTDSTEAKIPTNILTLGLGYSMDKTGFQMEYSMLRGKRNDTKSYSGHKATYDLEDAYMVGISIFSLF